MYAASSPRDFVGFDDQDEAVRCVDRSEKLAADEPLSAAGVRSRATHLPMRAFKESGVVI